MSQFSRIYEIQVPCSKGSGDTIQRERIETPLYIKESASGSTPMSNAAPSPGERISHGLPGYLASHWFIPAVSNVTMAATSTSTSHLTLSMNYVNNRGQGYANRNFNIFDYKHILKMTRLLGLMAVISYMTVILFTWIYANLKGYVYFSAGEPVLMIKYPEWVLGFLGIIVAIDFLRKELNDEIRHDKVYIGNKE